MAGVYVDLRKWEPTCDKCKHKSPKCTCKNRLPPGSIEHLFDEAARFRGYTVSQWKIEPWQCKARAIAHFLEHNLRESYAMERARLDSKDKPDTPNRTNWGRFRQGAR